MAELNKLIECQTLQQCELVLHEMHKVLCENYRPQHVQSTRKRRASPIQAMCSIVLSSSMANRQNQSSRYRWDGLSTQDVPLPADGRHTVVLAMKQHQTIKWVRGTK